MNVREIFARLYREGACNGMGLDVVTPRRGKYAHVHIYPCTHCPVRADCLSVALELESNSRSRQDRWGIWGGLNPAERAKIEQTRRTSGPAHAK